MNESKYIIHRHSVYIFPLFVDHSNFAQLNGLRIEEIQGAGFISEGIKGLVCYGKSVSLDIVSREDEDTKCVHDMFDMRN